MYNSRRIGAQILIEIYNAQQVELLLRKNFRKWKGNRRQWIFTKVSNLKNFDLLKERTQNITDKNKRRQVSKMEEDSDDSAESDNEQTNII